MAMAPMGLPFADLVPLCPEFLSGDRHEAIPLSTVPGIVMYGGMVIQLGTACVQVCVIYAKPTVLVYKRILRGLLPRPAFAQILFNTGCRNGR